MKVVESEVPAVVLAGVHAWGGSVLDRVRPRPLLPLGDRPLIAHVLAWLSGAGIRRASICANSETALLKQSLAKGQAWGVEVEYYEDMFPRGPAGCVADALAGREGAGCVVMEGTIVPDLNLGELLRCHRESGAALTIAATKADSPSCERSEASLVPLGIYVFSPDALNQVPRVGYQDIKEALIPRLYSGGRHVAVHVVPAGSMLRVRDADSYLEVNRSVLRRMATFRLPLPGYVAQGPNRIHEDAHVDPAARLIGPVVVGACSTVGAGALISGPTTIGNDCTVGAGAIVSRSILWNGCSIGDRALVDHCILTDGAQVEPRAVLRNALGSAAPSWRSPFWRAAQPGLRSTPGDHCDVRISASSAL